MNLEIEHIDGFWWPKADRRGRPVISRDCNGAVFDLLKHVPGRDLVIQAGANVGLYPLALADFFQTVITVEPDPANFACLRRNLEARDALKRVEAHRVAFGADVGSCEMVVVEPDNCGAHRIAPGGGSIMVLPIDGLDLWGCDLIWLDIEGHELAALKGAQATIEAFRPVIAIEEKGLSRAYGVEAGEAGRWLAALGYEETARIGNDRIYRSIP